MRIIKILIPNFSYMVEKKRLQLLTEDKFIFKIFQLTVKIFRGRMQLLQNIIKKVSLIPNPHWWKAQNKSILELYHLSVVFGSSFNLNFL